MNQHGCLNLVETGSPLEPDTASLSLQHVRNLHASLGRVSDEGCISQRVKSNHVLLLPPLRFGHIPFHTQLLREHKPFEMCRPHQSSSRDLVERLPAWASADPLWVQL